MERDYALAVLEREARRLLEVVGSDDERLGLAVPCCPGWALADVVEHLGRVYNWAGTIVGDRLSEPPSRDTLPRRPEHVALPDWMADRLVRLVGALSDVPGDATMWTFSSSDPTAAFWWRRQAHETLIHRVDAEAAGEMSITAAEPDLAADNIDELFRIRSFTSTDDGAGDPAGGSRPAEPVAETGWPASVHLHATDLDGAEWTIDTSRRSVSRRHSKADVALRGTAWALARWCWGRPAGELEAFGDIDAAERWRRSVLS